MFKQLRIEEVTMSEFINILEYCKRYRMFCNRPKQPDECVGVCAYIKEYEIKIELTYKQNNGKAITVVAYKDDRDIKKLVRSNPLQVWSNFNRYYKVPRLHGDREAPFSSSAILYFNREHNRTRTDKCIGYDMNSAYAYAMCNAPLPDTEHPLEAGFVQEGQMGFEPDGSIVKLGRYATFRFKLLDNEPFKRYALHWYDIKKNSRELKMRKKAKDNLNIIVGYFQKYNCFLRSAIVEYCNNIIRYYINKYSDDILYCNTDSIVTKKHIKELKIGQELGEWKIEHRGSFAYIDYNYQWDFSVPIYRGTSKEWFKEGFDLINDPRPTNGNVYYYDKELMEIRKYE